MSSAPNLRADARDFALNFCRSGKPTDNAFIESFNGNFRVEHLNHRWFMSLDNTV